MIAGIGIDIVEIRRIERAIERDLFLQRVFTEKEILYCQNRKKGMAASFAGRFAAKEAFLKALGTGLRDGNLRDIEIINDALGCPELILYGNFKTKIEALGIKKSWLSISHGMEQAVAQCILER